MAKARRKRCSACNRLKHSTQVILGRRYCYGCFKLYKQTFESLSWSWPTKVRKVLKEVTVKIYKE